MTAVLWTTLIVLLANCVARILLVRGPKQWTKGDEGTYAAVVRRLREDGIGVLRQLGRDFTDHPGMHGMSPPTRLVPLIAARLLYMFTGSDYRSLSWVATAAACVAPALGALLGWHLAGPAGALGGAVLLSSMPLSLGLGCRALIDLPALTSQLLVVAVACLGPDWWPALAASLALAALTRESVRSAVPALLLVTCWLYGWDWQTVGVAFAVAAAGYCVTLRALTRMWPWQYPVAFVQRMIRGLELEPTGYAWNCCRGGALRLLTNLAQVSPLVLVGACVACGLGGPSIWLVGGAALVVLSYGAPWLDQQIRSAILSDALLRLALATVAPWWLLPPLVAYDVWQWRRLWVRGKVHGASTYELGQALEQIPREPKWDHNHWHWQSSLGWATRTLSRWGRPKQTVCLNMIVKDEAHIIRRCLESCKPWIDSWCIVDTGSTDGTQEIIREVLAGVPGELFERPWVDYGHNRTEAYGLAQGRSDWILFLDADWELRVDHFPVLGAKGIDYYDGWIDSWDGDRYSLIRVVRSDLSCTFEGATHESIHCSGERRGTLEGITFFEHPDSSRRLNVNKNQEDIALLRKAVEADPRNGRALFYLAQTLYDEGEIDQAFECYVKRVQMGRKDEEAFYSLFQLAQIHEDRGDWAKAEQLYLTAYQCRPSRAEPLIALAHYYNEHKMPAVALIYAQIAMAMKPKPSDVLFLIPECYGGELAKQECEAACAA